VGADRSDAGRQDWQIHVVGPETHKARSANNDRREGLLRMTRPLGLCQTGSDTNRPDDENNSLKFDPARDLRQCSCIL
jgi:hypothetical protein